jgi:hypothetical protein
MPGRPHGVRKQDWGARQSFALEAKRYNEARRQDVQTSARPVVERNTWSDGSPMRVMCWCNERPQPHFHGAMELRKFEEDLRRPPIPWRNQERV